MDRRVLLGLAAMTVLGIAIAVMTVTRPWEREVPHAPGTTAPVPSGGSERAAPPVSDEKPVVLTGAPLLVHASVGGAAHRFHRPGAQDATAEVTDGGLGAVGERTVRGPLPLRDQVTVVHVGASWCLPCVLELPAVFAMASRILAAGGRSVIALTDATEAGPQAAGRKLVETYARVVQAPPPEAPPGLQFRADPDAAWIGLADRFFAGEGAFREGGLPLTLVFDRCGDLVLAAQNRLDAAAIEAIEERVTREATVRTCSR